MVSDAIHLNVRPSLLRRDPKVQKYPLESTTVPAVLHLTRKSHPLEPQTSTNAKYRPPPPGANLQFNCPGSGFDHSTYFSCSFRSTNSRYEWYWVTSHRRVCSIVCYGDAVYRTAKILICTSASHTRQIGPSPVDTATALNVNWGRDLPCTVISRLTKIIRSVITFVSRNVIFPRRFL